MAKRRFVLFQNQVKEFCRKGWQSKVIGRRGNIILVEAEVPEATDNISAYRTEEMINERREC